MMGLKVGEIFVEFGMKGAEKMKDFAKDIANMPLNIAASTAAFGGLSLTFAGFMDDMLGMTKGLREFNAETGLSTDGLEKWEQVARRVGLSNNIVQGSFSNLVTGLAKIRIGQGNPAQIQAFGQLGINDYWSASPERIMAEMRAGFLARRTPKSRQDFMEWMKQAGISPEMALAFQSNLSDPARMAKMSPLYGKSGQDAAAEFTRVISEVTDVFRRDFLDFFKGKEPDLPVIARGLETSAKIITIALDHLFQLVDIGSKGWKYGPGKMIKGIIDEYAGNIVEKRDLWKPGKGAPVTVNQHFYGDVDSDDIDTSTETLKGTLTKTMRLMGKGGV